MKKLTLIVTLLSVTMVTGLRAQTANAVTEISSIQLNDGKNTVRMPDGSGSFQFVKRGDKISDLVFTGSNGKTIRLVAIPGNTGGKLPTPCKYPLPDACFGIPNSAEVAMCFCKPGDKTAQEKEYNMVVKQAILFRRKSGGGGDY